MLFNIVDSNEAWVADILGVEGIRALMRSKGDRMICEHSKDGVFSVKSFF